MARNCLQIIQTVCNRLGITAPSLAVNSPDIQVQQLVALSNEEGVAQTDRPADGWQSMQKEINFTTVATQVQFTISALAPGLDYIINDTIWNRDLRRPVYGPRTPPQWQQMKAMNINGPFNSFRIVNDQMNFYPVPTAGQRCYFEYVSKYWVSGIGGPSVQWINDLDATLLSDELVILGTLWRWKSAKGLDYSEDFIKYERMLMDAMARDAGKDHLYLDGCQYDILPGIFVPAGSWSVP